MVTALQDFIAEGTTEICLSLEERWWELLKKMCDYVQYYSQVFVQFFWVNNFFLTFH